MSSGQIVWFQCMALPVPWSCSSTDVEAPMPCHDQADVEAPGLEAGRPKVYLDPQQRSRPAAPHQGIVWPRIPQIIAPPPHLQRSPARPVFQYLGSCQPALLPSPNLCSNCVSTFKPVFPACVPIVLFCILCFHPRPHFVSAPALWFRIPWNK